MQYVPLTMLTTSEMGQFQPSSMACCGLIARHVALLDQELHRLGFEEVERFVEVLVVADRDPVGRGLDPGPFERCPFRTSIVRFSSL